MEFQNFTVHRDRRACIRGRMGTIIQDLVVSGLELYIDSEIPPNDARIAPT